MPYVNKTYDPDDFIALFDFTRTIVSHYRSWYRGLRRRFEVHPAVYDAMRLARPYDWHQLVLEYPHRSETDPHRLAYTRDERAGEDDRQTVTTVGKYLMRHFPLRDNIIRDIAALYSTPSDFKILSDVEQFVHAVNNGPNSCMCWREGRGVDCKDGEHRHPYHAYAPEFGWRMAVRLEGGRIDGRALLMHEDDGADGGTRYFVRSFRRGDGYSYTDDALEAWLKKQGYQHYSGWDGCYLAYITLPNGDFLAPYIDGDTQHVDVERRDGKLVLCISDSGEYECTNTDGTASCTDRECCECCGDYYAPEDMGWAGYNEDIHVCDGCLDDSYIYGYGRNRRQYYFHQDDAVYVESQAEHYHTDYLDHNGIVCTYDGDYEHQDNCVYIESCSEYYQADDDRVVCDHEGDWQLLDECEQLENGEWALEHETFVCAASGERYLTDDVDPVEIDGETYHPDNVPETEETDTETGE